MSGLGIDNGKLANHIARLAAIVVKKDFLARDFVKYNPKRPLFVVFSNFSGTVWKKNIKCVFTVSSDFKFLPRSVGGA